MSAITANELKTKGISVVESALVDGDEVTITVRGLPKYVVMNLNKYSKFREFELENAVREARADYAKGDVKRESVAEHMDRVLD